jgi:hypothetical protein
MATGWQNGGGGMAGAAGWQGGRGGEWGGGGGWGVGGGLLLHEGSAMLIHGKSAMNGKTYTRVEEPPGTGRAWPGCQARWLRD